MARHGSEADPFFVTGDLDVGDVTLDSTGLATEAKQNTQIGHLDGVEALLTAIDGRVDGLESLLGAGKTLQFAEIDRATSGEVVAAAGASTKIYVVSYVLIVASDVTVEWRSAATGISGAMSCKAGGGVSAQGSIQAPLLRTADNEALNVQLGSGVQVSGHLAYFTGA